MPGPELPPDLVRTLADHRKRLAAVEKRRPREVANLDDLDDTEVLYTAPTGAPADGDALVWVPDADVLTFGGLWKPGWTAMPTYTWTSGGYVDATGGLDIYADVTPTSGWYAVAVSLQGETPLPADTCGWSASVSVTAGGLAITFEGSHTSGINHGIWTGSTGDSGTYGWQAADPAGATPSTSTFAVVSVSASLEVVGSATAFVLTDPGTSAAHYGDSGCTGTDLDVTIELSMVRIAPL